MERKNRDLSRYACKDLDAIRFKPINKDIRTDFYRDIDRIIYSLSYVRYIDKTQVYSNNDNDMISKRMTHVQMVSKIARTIGRALNLNEDLIEAAALGHDLGHVPFGHVGEKILNDISFKYGEGYFSHNVQSVRVLMNLENNGNGCDITLQVLDAIFCHNGESIENVYEPVSKTKEEFIKEYNESYINKDILKTVKPMTLEGCIVRISDIVAYIGKDIEDSIRLGKINIEDVPDDITSILGKTNSQIVNTIILDIINNSINKNYIRLSDTVFKSLKKLIDFNYKNIYLKANTKEQIDEYTKMFNKLFDLYFEHVTNNITSEDIFVVFLNNMEEKYLKNTTPARKVIDYISGMTDDFFQKQYRKYFG